MKIFQLSVSLKESDREAVYEEAYEDYALGDGDYANLLLVSAPSPPASSPSLSRDAELKDGKDGWEAAVAAPRKSPAEADPQVPKTKRDRIRE